MATKPMAGPGKVGGALFTFQICFHSGFLPLASRRENQKTANRSLTRVASASISLEQSCKQKLSFCSEEKSQAGFGYLAKHTRTDVRVTILA